MARIVTLLLTLLIAACAAPVPFGSIAGVEAIPDERTAKMVSLAIFQGQAGRSVGDFNDLASRLEAYRYRRSDHKRDPKGEAWFIHASPEEEAEFNRKCAGNCVGGELFMMALSARDGKLLELYIPQ